MKNKISISLKKYILKGKAKHNKMKKIYPKPNPKYHKIQNTL